MGGPTVRRGWLAAGTATATLAFGILLALQAISGDWLPPDISVSQYGVGSTRVLFSLFAIAVGLTPLLLDRAAPTGRSTTIVLVIGAIGALVMATVPTDPGGLQHSVPARIHMGGSGLALVFIPAGAALLLARRFPRWRWWAWSLVLLSYAALILLLLAAAGRDVFGVGIARSWTWAQTGAIVSDLLLLAVVTGVLQANRKRAAATATLGGEYLTREATVRRNEQKSRPRVVVLGGGFAGLCAVGALKKADVDVVLVDRHTYTTFQPLLYQVATAGLNPGDVTFFLRATRMAQRNVRFRQGEVVRVDPVANTVSFADGERIDFDYLIVATGAATNYFDTPGAAEHTSAIYTREQALRLRDKIFTMLEHAAASGSTEPMTVAVIGGGATGVEMAGALAELRNDTMSVVYPELDAGKVHVVLVEMGSTVLGAFAPSLQRYSLDALADRGVEVRLNTAVKSVDENGLELADGSRIDAGVVIWSAGVTVPQVVGGWGLTQGRGGRIEVGQTLRAKGFPHIFAAGDVSISPDQLPQLAQPAMQGGRHAARQILAELDGRAADPFVYSDKGTMATIGRRAAIAEIALPFGRQVRLRGTLAWLAWLSVHIVQLLGSRNRLATTVNLATRYLAPKRRINPIVGEVPVFDRRQDNESHR